MCTDFVISTMKFHDYKLQYLQFSSYQLETWPSSKKKKLTNVYTTFQGDILKLLK